MLSSLGSALPKPTLVAELNDPKTFGKALDAVMIAVNKELKAKAIEKAAAEEAAEEAGAGPGQAGAGTFPDGGRAIRRGAGPASDRLAEAQLQGHPGAGIPPHARLGDVASRTG